MGLESSVQIEYCTVFLPAERGECRAKGFRLLEAGISKSGELRMIVLFSLDRFNLRQAQDLVYPPNVFI